MQEKIKDKVDARNGFTRIGLEKEQAHGPKEDSDKEVLCVRLSSVKLEIMCEET